MTLPFALAVFGWVSTATGGGQTVLTRGCLDITCPQSRTNIVCGGWIVDDHGISVSNHCPEVPTPSISVRCNPPAGAVLGQGVRTATCDVLTNGAFVATCVFTLAVESTLPKAIMECPTNRVFILPCETNRLCVAYDLPTVTNGVLVECSPPPGTCFPVGVSWVGCRATNDCGALTECSFAVTVTREAPLSIRWATSNSIYMFVPCESNCVPVTYPPPLVTNGTLIACTPPSGTCFPLGVTFGLCRATNDCGDSAYCFFDVKLWRAEPPVILCPTDIEASFQGVACATNNCLTVNYPLPEVRGGTLIECTPPPGTCFLANPPGTTHRVVCRATNECGASAQCAFSIRMYGDPQGPRIYCVGFQAFTNACGSGCVPVFYREPIAVLGTGRCSVPQGACLPVGTTLVHCVATNACGFDSECFFEIRVYAGSSPPPPTLRVVQQAEQYFLF